VIFWLLLGVVIGYLFKPQIDEALQRVYRMMQEGRKDSPDNPPDNPDDNTRDT
jgi:hypothetical protein